MEVYRVEIPFRLPSCNTYINECRRNKYAGAKMKAETEEMICFYLQKIPHIDKPIQIHFHWVEENKRRDLDGICFAKKFILDAMVKSNIINDDNRKCVTAFRDTFSYDKESKVILTIKRSEE